jgi:hypothetical protein
LAFTLATKAFDIGDAAKAVEAARQETASVPMMATAASLNECMVLTPQ